MPYFIKVRDQSLTLGTAVAVLLNGPLLKVINIKDVYLACNALRFVFVTYGSFRIRIICQLGQNQPSGAKM